MKNSINILYNGNYDHTFYEKFFLNMYEKVNMIKFTKSSEIPEDIDLILFTGNYNIHAKWYNDKSTSKLKYDVDRDSFERDIFSLFKNIPKLGVNRGALLLTALCGGDIIQSINGHNCDKHECEFTSEYLYKISSRNNRTFIVKSNHESMMFPYNLNSDNYNIILTSKYYLSNFYKNGYGDSKNIKDIKIFYEPEIVKYNNYNTLCIQGDFDSENTEYNQLCYNLIINLLKNKK